MKIVLIGAPGSGKGTLASLLVEKHNLVLIGTGEILREEINKQTEIGLMAQNLISAGNLVPDQLIIQMVENRLKCDDVKDGFILDGFPRTINQYNAMKGHIDIDKAVYLNVREDELINRLSTRRICPKCKEIYSTILHGFSNCPKCGVELAIRKDDSPESIRNRLKIYNDETAPIIECFRADNKLVEIVDPDVPQKTLQIVEKMLGLKEEN